MPDKLAFELVAPDRLVMSTEADMVVVPGQDGDFGVLIDHAPVISTIRPGVVEVHGAAEGGDTTRIFVRGGFADVTPKGLTVLAEQAIPLAELDREELERQVSDLEEDVTDATDNEARDKAQHKLDQLRELVDSLEL